MRTEPFIEELPCKLTRDEIFDRGAEQARVVTALIQHEDDAKAERDRLKRRSDTLKERLAVLADAVNTGTEQRATRCYERPEPASQRIETVRIDTFERVGTRPMSEKEIEDHKQGKLFATEQLEGAVMRARDDFLAAASRGGATSVTLASAGRRTTVDLRGEHIDPDTGEVLDGPAPPAADASAPVGSPLNPADSPEQLAPHPDDVDDSDEPEADETE